MLYSVGVDILSTTYCVKGGDLMTDVRLLKEKIKETGLKKVYIAKQLGLTYQGYLRKENGQSEFISSEISMMKDLLSLSLEDVSDIFLQ